jgi:nicotinate phosphoribosyltransferase
MNYKDFKDYTDKYFLRSRDILQSNDINPIVRYQVFGRKNIDSLSGISDVIEFIRDVTGFNTNVYKKHFKIYALEDGQEYTANTPIMKIEGRVQDLIDLETVYLGMLSGALTGDIDLDSVKEKSVEIIKEAKGKPVYYFGARHFSPDLDRAINDICQGAGFVGCSTDIGAKAYGPDAVGGGTIPHALILSYAALMAENGIKGNPTIEANKGFDSCISEDIPRVALIDTYNREIDDAVDTAIAVPSLSGIRIDTCGENYSQGSDNPLLPAMFLGEEYDKYFRGKGVTIAGVLALRMSLNAKGLDHIKITVSSGFNPEKTKAFMKADETYQNIYNRPLFDFIGTGSIAKPVMTTSDIVAYYSEKQNKWCPLSKVGRGEIACDNLKEIK